MMAHDRPHLRIFAANFKWMAEDYIRKILLPMRNSPKHIMELHANLTEMMNKASWCTQYMLVCQTCSSFFFFNVKVLPAAAGLQLQDASANL